VIYQGKAPRDRAMLHVLGQRQNRKSIMIPRSPEITSQIFKARTGLFLLLPSLWTLVWGRLKVAQKGTPTSDSQTAVRYVQRAVTVLPGNSGELC
jgi:hypothetical protein